MSYIKREADLEWLAKVLPKRLRYTSDRIYMIGNPRGYGKSALVMEMAYMRDERKYHPVRFYSQIFEVLRVPLMQRLG